MAPLMSAAALPENNCGHESTPVVFPRTEPRTRSGTLANARGEREQALTHQAAVAKTIERDAQTTRSVCRGYAGLDEIARAHPTVVRGHEGSSGLACSSDIARGATIQHGATRSRGYECRYH